MDKVDITTERLKLAQVRFYSESHKGVEIPRDKAYVFLYRLEDNQYMNLFNPYQEYPVYGRVPYSNTSRDGMDYGTKITLLCGDEMSGPCYVLENIGMDNIFGEKTITMDQLKKFIFSSNMFFIDRPAIVEEEAQKKGPVDRFIAFNKKYREDRKKREQFQQYLNDCLRDELRTK